MNPVRFILYSVFFSLILCGSSYGLTNGSQGFSGGSGDVRGKETPPRAGENVNDPGRFAAAASLDYDIQGIELGDLSYGNRGLSYLRDRELYAAARFSFRGAGLSARIGVSDMDRPRYRKISDFMVQASYFSPVAGAEVYYRRAGRYRIADSPFGTGKLWNQTRQGSSVNFESAGLNLFLFMKDLSSLNRDYSYGAAFEQSGRHEKSAGSFILLAGANYQRIHSPVPLVPGDTQALGLYRKLFGLTGWRRTGFSIGIGFAGTLVLPHGFFLAPQIGLAFNPSQMEYFTLAGARKAFRFDSLRGIGRISAGYDGGRFFTGIIVNFEAFIIPTNRYKAELWTGDLSAGFFSGFRV